MNLESPTRTGGSTKALTQRLWWMTVIPAIVNRWSRTARRAMRAWRRPIKASLKRRSQGCFVRDKGQARFDWLTEAARLTCQSPPTCFMAFCVKPGSVAALAAFVSSFEINEKRVEVNFPPLFLILAVSPLWFHLFDEIGVDGNFAQHSLPARRPICKSGTLEFRRHFFFNDKFAAKWMQ